VSQSLRGINTGLAAPPAADIDIGCTRASVRTIPGPCNGDASDVSRDGLSSGLSRFKFVMTGFPPDTVPPGPLPVARIGFPSSDCGLYGPASIGRSPSSSPGRNGVGTQPGQHVLRRPWRRRRLRRGRVLLGTGVEVPQPLQLVSARAIGHAAVHDRVPGRGIGTRARTRPAARTGRLRAPVANPGRVGYPVHRRARRVRLVRLFEDHRTARLRWQNRRAHEFQPMDVLAAQGRDQPLARVQGGLRRAVVDRAARSCRALREATELTSDRPSRRVSVTGGQGFGESQPGIAPRVP
jgi:hypothetical protein